MQIRVKIHKVFQDTGAMKAVASVTVDEAFAIHGVKLIETANGRFASMPNEIRKDKDGNEVHRDVCRPCSCSLPRYTDLAQALGVGCLSACAGRQPLRPVFQSERFSP